MEEERLQNSIKSAFYIDKLMLPPRTETGEMTAYEIQERLTDLFDVSNAISVVTDGRITDDVMARDEESMVQAIKKRFK